MAGKGNSGDINTQKSIKHLLNSAHSKMKDDDLEFFKAKLSELIKAKPDRAVLVLKKWLEH